MIIHSISSRRKCGLERRGVKSIEFPPDACYNDYLMAKRRRAFRRAALLLSAAVWLLRRIFIARSIGRMLDTIIRHPIIMVIRR
jgi:hypothetical protein